MGNEISQLDAPVIQLRESRAQPKVSYSKEIGEAEIIHTIFGKAKVRIIRKHDNFRRALWLTAAFGVAATSTLVLQDWYAAREAESRQSAEPAAPVGAAVQESAPAQQAENVVTSAVSAAAVLEPATPARPEVGKTPVIQPSAPQVEAPKPVVAVQPKPKPLPPKPVTAPAQVVAPTAVPARPPQAQLPAAVNNALKTQTVTPPAIKPMLPKPPAAAVVAPPVVKPVVQPAASSPAAVPAPDAPAVKEGISAVDKQMSAPINVQGN